MSFPSLMMEQKGIAPLAPMILVGSSEEKGMFSFIENVIELYVCINHYQVSY